ncbi:hypothetical protein EF148_15220 [Stenotrophomonas maltophilia]|uniref:Uncharacterized protein n=1 Tax=Stenotrophomonas maltophilia TaxID=40324 RepID=A0AAD0FNM9_STEMA|nr:hypothetical protein SmaCSM2_18825 [Stenotrophomonas maltophilia]MBA2130771.1 hypothetical protein [Stenotrophomonas maltophilia]
MGGGVTLWKQQAQADSRQPPLPWVVGRAVWTGAAGWVAAVRKTVTCLVNEMITVRVCYDPVPGAM